MDASYTEKYDDCSFTPTTELYFLIQKFLSNGPLQETFKVMRKEVENLKLLPKRIDWQGNKHDRKVDDVERQFQNMRSDYLLQLCSQICALSNRNAGNSSSLLSLNYNSISSNKEYDHNFRQLWNHVTRYHGVPLKRRNVFCNIVNIIRGREMSEPLPRNLIITPNIYSSLQIQRKTVGHLSAVYCLLFDHSGNYIITGADDLLIKLWSSRTGRLIATLRGASAEITDIAINSENTLLAAGSIDRILRVWNLQTGTPVAILVAHNGMVTSLNFCPTSCWGLNYLISTSTDGSVAFWSYTTDIVTTEVQFRPKPILYHERIRPGQAQMICSSFSPGGTFLATGSVDHNVRAYYMKSDEGPQRILEVEAHTDRVDSIQWAHSGLKFLSGSKDGTAVIWHFETMVWKSHYLYMTTKLPNAKKPQEETKKLKVNMVGWDRSDTWVVTAVSDFSLKVWCAATGELQKVLTGHTDEVYVLESHPIDSNMILSAGHDGQLFVWDLLKGEVVAQFLNSIEGQGYGAIFDVKWSPDGYSIAASDSHGHLLIFGFGSGSVLFEQLPKELFFHTDYRPLMRDSHQQVLDEQTQLPPHLMPPPFLVDIDGNPYPPMLQRLVPGREHCKTEQLVPNIVVGNEGTQEVIQGIAEDQAIERLLNHNNDNEGRNHVLVRSNSRRNVEGIRQSTGEWQKDPNMKWKKHLIVQPLKPSVLKKSLQYLVAMERFEVEEYHRELCRRPHMISSTAISDEMSKLLLKRRQRQAAYQTRRARNQVLAEGQTTTHHSEPEASDSTLPEMENDDDDSSESDWVQEEGVNLEPLKRSKRRQVNQNVVYDASEDEREDAPSPEQGPSHRPLKEAKVPKELNNVAPQESSKFKLNNGEVPEVYKPSEWLSETKPKKTPCYPQMGDELVYFMQGHQLYLEAVKAKKIYEINNKDLPWTKLHLRDHEFVKIVGINYEIKPPRLCCLKVTIQDDEGRLTGKVFTIKYHDMPDVLDFIVLRQMYDTAMSRNWAVGNKFRCMIEDAWWIGEIMASSCACETYPNSSFMCYEIKWANGESERMSPWDLEPIDESRKPENEKEAIPVLKEEMQNILYHPSPEDWPNTDRDTACVNILQGLTKIMELAIAEPFLVPVDLNAYPSYAFLIEYPIDLSTIKARFENKFYRRVTSAQFDVRYIATNAEKFNERHSVIVKRARILTELCLRVIKQCVSIVDVPAMYHQLADSYNSTDDEVDVEIAPSTSTNRNLRVLPSRSMRHAKDWKREAQSLLDDMWKCEDSAPFRNPVCTFKYPDYSNVIDKPMDLSIVRDNLSKNKYRTPSSFCKDIRQIFQNSRTYNTNNRSKIYVMTVRLSAIFEEHIKTIIHNWKEAKKKDYKRSVRSQDDLSSSSEESLISHMDSDTTYSTDWTQGNIKSQSQESNSCSSSSDEDIPLNKLFEQNKHDSKSGVCKELTVSLTPHIFGQSESSQSYKSSRKKSKSSSIISSEVDENTKSSVNIEFVNVNMESNSNTRDTHSSLENVKIRDKSESDSHDCYEPPTKESNSESEDTDHFSSSNLPNAATKSDAEESYKPPRRGKSQTSSSEDDSEYNFKPQRTRTGRSSNSTGERYDRSSRKRVTRKMYTADSDDSFEFNEKENLSNAYSSECSDLDGSDNEPLSIQVRRSGMKNGKRSSKRSFGGSSEEPSTSSHRSQGNKKRRKKESFSDSDTEKEVYVKRFKDNSENGKCFTSVSSRGRIRKLTARARAMLRE